MARMGITAPFIVIDVEIFVSGMPSNSNYRAEQRRVEDTVETRTVMFNALTLGTSTVQYSYI